MDSSFLFIASVPELSFAGQGSFCNCLKSLWVRGRNSCSFPVRWFQIRWFQIRWAVQAQSCSFVFPKKTITLECVSLTSKMRRGELFCLGGLTELHQLQPRWRVHSLHSGPGLQWESHAAGPEGRTDNVSDAKIHSRGAEPSPGLSGIRISLWGHLRLLTSTRLMFH